MGKTGEKQTPANKMRIKLTVNEELAKLQQRLCRGKPKALDNLEAIEESIKARKLEKQKNAMTDEEKEVQDEMLLEQLKRIHYVMDKPTFDLTRENMRHHMAKLKGV